MRYYGASATGRISDLHVRDTHSYYATSEAGRDPVLSIRLYEDRIKQARADLAHVNAAIKIFEASVEVRPWAGMWMCTGSISAVNR